MGTVAASRAYNRPLKTFSLFKYLGYLLTATKNYWPEVIDNICNFSKSWSYLDWFLGREGAYTWMSGRFYVMFIQVILLFRL